MSVSYFGGLARSKIFYFGGLARSKIFRGRGKFESRGLRRALPTGDPSGLLEPRCQPSVKSSASASGTLPGAPEGPRGVRLPRV